MKKYQLNITFKESDIADWGTPEGSEWEDVLKKVAEGLHDDCTLHEIKSYALSEIFPEFNDKLQAIIEGVIKQEELLQFGEDACSEWHGVVYGYIYDLESNIPEEQLGILKEKIEAELTSIDSIYTEEI